LDAGFLKTPPAGSVELDAWTRRSPCWQEAATIYADSGLDTEAAASSHATNPATSATVPGILVAHG